MEMFACQDLAVPADVMQHVVRVESSFNPYAIGVVGARLARQPRSLEEAVATAAKLEREGYNFSIGLAQVNRYNLAAQGLDSYEEAFSACPNLAAGARILADCRNRADRDWGKAFSCYYSGDFERGFRDGYVQKVHASIQAAGQEAIHSVPTLPLSVIASGAAVHSPIASLRERRGLSSAGTTGGTAASSVAHEQDDAHAAAMRPHDSPFVPRVTGPEPPGAGIPGHAPGVQGRSRDREKTDSAFVF
ncbi:MAG TPA: lytic transglycosylase domain-containing protein [Luteimonas sp.]